MSKFCGAKIWKTLTIQGILFESTYEAASVTCTRDKGHPAKHAGWLKFRSSVGEVKALVEW